jgi:hypothetical protein
MRRGSRGVRVTTATTGPDLDEDGYDSGIGGASGRQRKLSTNGTALVTGVPVGEQPHFADRTRVQLHGKPRQPALSTASQPGRGHHLALHLRRRDGPARIVTTTAGMSLDADGYAVVTARGTKTVDINDTLLVAGPQREQQRHPERRGSQLHRRGRPQPVDHITIGGTTDVTFRVTCRSLPSY